VVRVDVCWLEDNWLVAVREPVPADEVGRWWNCKETDVLDSIVASAPVVRIGEIATCGCESEPASPARRVFELLFLRGTLPQQFADDGVGQYAIPVLNQELRRALLEALQPRDSDHAALKAGKFEQIAAFLDEHMGAGLLTTSRGNAVEVRLDHECST
jgi:hypothetical protein